MAKQWEINPHLSNLENFCNEWFSEMSSEEVDTFITESMDKWPPIDPRFESEYYADLKELYLSDDEVRKYFIAHFKLH